MHTAESIVHDAQETRNIAYTFKYSQAVILSVIILLFEKCIFWINTLFDIWFIYC